METAYLHALDFYATHFPDLIRIRPLLHLAKREDENPRVCAFRQTTPLPLLTEHPDCVSLLEAGTAPFEQVLLAQSGLVDAAGVCRALAQPADLYLEHAGAPRRDAGGWRVGSVSADKLVLATGAYHALLHTPYLTLRAVWGQRIDIRTATELPCHIHQHLSIAATDDGGGSAIGATHDLHYHPQTTSRPYDLAPGREQLLHKAAMTLKLEKVRILADYAGLRSGSNDYLPMIGPLVDVQSAGGEHFPGAYIINGVGGYGFVLAPLLARQLAASIIGGEPASPILDPGRFFRRWVGKM